MLKKKHGLLLFLAGLMMVTTLAGCNPPPEVPSLSIENIWGLPLPDTTETGAFYLTITNTSTKADKLIGASSPACGSVELHETTMESDGTMGMDSMTGGGVLIPAGSQVVLKSGALHLMCVDKKANQFTTGNKIELTLTFEKSGQMKVSAEIREK